MRRACFIVFFTVALMGCGAGNGERAWQAAVESVIDADRSFARIAADSAVHSAYAGHAAVDALLFRPGPVPAWEVLDRDPVMKSTRLDWQPDIADAALARDLAYTAGMWRAHSRSDPAFQSEFGQYVTVWRASENGWRFVLTFTTSQPYFPPPAESVWSPALPETRADSLRDPAASGLSLRIADEDLNEAIANLGGAAYHAYANARVRWLRDGRAPGSGLEAAAADTLPWLTLGAAAASSGDLGYSWGATAAGSVTQRYYVRVWRRLADGAWNVVLDAASGS